MDLFNIIFEETNKNIFQTYTNYSNLNHYYSTLPHKDTRYRELTWQKQINYKFYIFKNFFFNSKFNESEKNSILTMFYKSQKKIMALYKFKLLFTKKFKKFKGEQIDLNFNLLHENDKNNIVLLQNNEKNIFNIFDIIKLICNALSFECNFFSEPKTIKNPWTNMKFSISNLINIYFYIKNSSIEMPLLFLRYFQSSFCLTTFKDQNQLIIKQYIINNYKNFEKNKKINYIEKMLRFFNNTTCKNAQIIIDPLFPKNKLIPIFEKFLKKFLLLKFSYESDIRIKNNILLKKQLRLFKKQQPLLGRKIFCRNIKKLYCVSELKYNYNELFFTDCYIPSKDMINLTRKCFFIDFNNNFENNYSIFPNLNLDSQYNNFAKPYRITNLPEFLKNLIFTNYQKKIIHEQFTQIFNNIQPINRDLQCQTRQWDTQDIISNNITFESFINILSTIENLPDNDSESNNNQDQNINDDDTSSVDSRLIHEFNQLYLHDNDNIDHSDEETLLDSDDDSYQDNTV